VETELAKRFKIEGFPTLKFFRGAASVVSDYGGGRTASEIVSWVTKKSAPATIPVTTKAEVSDAVEAGSVAFVGLFTSADSSLSTIFTASAGASEAGAFMVAYGEAGAALRSAYGVGEGDAVVAVNNFEGQPNVVIMEGTSVDLFVSANSLPYVVAFSQETVSKIFAGAIKTHYLLFASPKASSYEGLLSAFRTLASKHVGELLFVSVDPSGDGNDKILQYFGITDDKVPTAAIVKMAEAGMKKYLFGEGDLIKGMSAFLDSFKDGSIKPSLKSAPVPAKDATSSVRVLVGKSFDAEILAGPEKISLVEFYAPWCGHCKALAPVWDELGAAYKADTSVGIFKMDATENEIDHPEVNIKGFPTIVAFVGAPGSKTVVEYDGARELKAFKFVVRNHGARGCPLATCAPQVLLTLLYPTRLLSHPFIFQGIPFQARCRCS